MPHWGKQLRLPLAGDNMLLSSAYPGPALTYLFLAAPVIEGAISGLTCNPYSIYQRALLHLLGSAVLGVLIIYCSIKNFPRFKRLETTYMYYLTVAMGQESRRGLAGSSGSGFWQGCYQDVGRGRSYLVGKNPFPNALTWLLEGIRSPGAVGLKAAWLLSGCWLQPSVLCPVGLCVGSACSNNLLLARKQEGLENES